MKEQQLNLLRKKYHSLLGVKREILAYQKEKEELETDPTVRRYLQILQILEDNKNYSFYGIEKLSNDQILETAVKTVNFSYLNGIYVYMGSYKINTTEADYYWMDYCVPRDSIDENYKVYRSVELNPEDEEYELKIYSEEQSKFENDNIILYPENDISNIRYYNDVRNMYFKEAVSHGENRALERVLDLQYKKKKKAKRYL